MSEYKHKFTFKRGLTYVLVRGRWVTGWRAWPKRTWQWLTKPFRRRYVVTAIDKERGAITLEERRRWWRFL